MRIKFYDTCSLLKKVNNLFDEHEDFAISSITLEELENIKTSSNKDADIKFAARKLLHELDDHFGEYKIVIFKENMLFNMESLPATNDLKIIGCARHLAENNEIVFVTNDLSCKAIARLFFKEVESVKEDIDDYDGIREITMDNDEMAYFYSNQYENMYNLYTNEYLLVRSQETNEVVDKLCWDGETYRRLDYETFKSKHFGDIKPFKNDPYQACAADSFNRNKITMVKGPAGSGKTYLSLGYLMSELERGRIDKIIIFCNTVATKNSAKLGYYPGTRDEKLLDSQIGNLLTSKFGARFMVEHMINDDQLVLLPMSDIRGYDTSGMKAGIYISEAQNLDIELMKLTLQRIGEDSICIIDGDCKAQVDDINFAGASNGMKRASKVFRGSDIYGEITLKQIHRSKIAEIAEKM